MRSHTAYLLSAVLLALTISCQLMVGTEELQDGRCRGDEKICNGRCVSKSDPNTMCAKLACGPCVIPHAMAVCGLNGDCAVATCIQPYATCGTNECQFDLDHNPEHCGLCTRNCNERPPANGKAGCSNGQCTIGECNQGWEDCNGDLLDGCEAQIWTNEQCTYCGVPCAPGTTCNRGVCEATPDAAAP